MNNTEKLVNFRSRGLNLFGIFHPAQYTSRGFGVIFPNSGFHNRVGPHRMYVKAARRLSQLGFSVLRIDCAGLGESEGEITETHFDAHDPEDTMAAISFLTQEEKIEKIVLIGLCAGARNALKTAAKDDRVDSVVLWSLPIISISPSMPAPKEDPRGWMGKTGAKFHLKKTTKKALSVKAWREYLSRGGDFRSIMVSYRTMMWGLLANEKKWVNSRHGEFFDAFESFLSSGRKGLFVYGERDIMLIKEFEEKFKELSMGKKHSCEDYIVPKGNHTFTSIESERIVIDKTVNWLSKQYGLE